MPLPEAPTAAEEAAKREKVGFAGLFSHGYWWPTILVGFMSASALMLVYALNTWLPVLMEEPVSTPRDRCRSCWCSTAGPSSAR